MESRKHWSNILIFTDDQLRDTFVGEKLILSGLIWLARAKTIVEIGVCYGDTTTWLCETAKHTNGHVYGFDLWEPHGVWLQFPQTGSKEQVEARLLAAGHSNFTLTKIDSRSEEFKQTLEIMCPSIDFAFIDGCHSYDTVKSDFELVYPRLANISTVVFHDTLRIDGCREYMVDFREQYSNEFDLIELPFGNGPRRVGISIAVRRSSTGINIDEICGSLSTPEDIYAKELRVLGHRR